jgi:hypothetical protein
VRFSAPGLDPEELTPRVIERIQDEGTLWLSGTVWQDRHAMRISVSNEDTTTADVDTSIEAILKAFRAEASEAN